MTNYEKLKEIFPEIPEDSGFDFWGDFWDEEYKGLTMCCRDCKHYEECEDWCFHKEHFELCNESSCTGCEERKAAVEISKLT